MDKGSSRQLSEGIMDTVCTIISMINLSNGVMWSYCHADWGINKTQISLPELEAMLKGQQTGLDFDRFKEMFYRNFAKVTPEDFIKEMESLGYKFNPTK